MESLTNAKPKGVGVKLFAEVLKLDPVWLSIDPAASVGWHMQDGDRHWSGKSTPSRFMDAVPLDEVDGRVFLVTVERAFYGDTTTWNAPKCRLCEQPVRKKFGGAGRTGAVTMIETQGFCVCEVVRRLEGRFALGFWRPIAASWRPKIGYPNRRDEAKRLAMSDFKKKFGRWANSDDEAEAYAITRAAQAGGGDVFPPKRRSAWQEVQG